ncbi:hypothetical protein [Burkholderia glumae]|uniref:hypothetical protein n=1 Tax=Burkholderia glumae TaxID=337 RepID=UPI002149D2BC|nr:hypothetical protein [Burkholderia glumae]MCR1769761.1 hypothetical protein [Burkholderia glumae]UVT00056.1 hypothetical protein EFP19_30875 [Burkholderia glumae]
MPYLLLPLVVFAVMSGLIYQTRQQADQIAGSGDIGIAEQAGHVRAIQAQAFAHACLEAAIAIPATIASDWPVTLPSGVVPIANARCETTLDTTTGNPDGRLVVASVPDSPGVAAQLMRALDGSLTWSRVNEPGQGTTLASGQLVTVPADTPVNSLVYQVRVSP